jgi:2'-5' RNA ligase
MRCFIAIELPEEAKQELQGMADQLRRAGVRAGWVRPDRMHLTLRFLGEIEEDQSRTAGEFLAHEYSGKNPFECAVQGAGAFPNVRRPSVIWAGVGPLEGGLAEIQALAEEAAAKIGLKPEKRPFHPHLTLGRIRKPEAAGHLGRALVPLKQFQGERFLVAGVTLFSSTLTPKGPIYDRIRECRF